MPPGLTVACTIVSLPIAQVPPVVVGGDDDPVSMAVPPDVSRMVASSPRSARVSSTTTTTRCSSTSTVEMVLRLPAPSSSDCGPAMRAVLLSAVTVTVVRVLRVTVSSTDPGTGCQSRMSCVGVTSPSLGVADGEVVVLSEGVGVPDEEGGLGGGVGDVDESSLGVQAESVEASSSAAAAARIRDITRRCCARSGPGCRDSS